MSSNTGSSWVLNLIDNITAPLRRVMGAAGQTGDTFSRIGASLLVFNQAAEAIGRLNAELQNTIAPGIAFQSSLAELQAISNVTDEQLEEIADRARSAAKAFGGELTGPVEVSKILLAELSPELAKNAEVMDLMTRNALTLSKTMGGDTKGATEALTTSMNQYGISLDDPMRAAQAMSEMMNIMAEAGRLGASEVSDTKEALKQSGAAAKAANVHFAEANAALQVLAISGRKGSEAGVSLRNVIGTLSKGRFLYPGVQEELAAVGINVNDLADKNKSLADRLKPLRGIMHDTALMSKLFGVENYNAALGMVQNIDKMEEYTVAVQGTNAAQEQANIIMDTCAEKQARQKAWFDDIKVSIFNATEAMMPFFTVTGSVIEKAASLGMAFHGLSIVMDVKLGKAIKEAGKWMGNLGKAFWAGIKSAAGFAAASVSSFAAFRATAVSACRAVSAAIVSIPIIGWIAGIIAALIALGTYFYNTSESFRGFLWGLWGYIKAAFTGIGGFLKEVFEGVWHWIKGVFNPANWFDDDYKFADGLKKITDAATRYGEEVGAAFAKGRDEGIADFRADRAAEAAEEEAMKNPVSSGLLDLHTVAGGAGGIAPGIAPRTVAAPAKAEPAQGLQLAGSGSGGGRSITMNITQHNHFSGSQNPKEIAEVVFRMLNDRMRDSALAAG